MLDIDIFGKSSHAAATGNGRDALLAGARFVTEAYRAEREAFADDVFRLLKFGAFSSGTARNIISGHTRISGTARCFGDGVLRRMLDGLRDVAAEIERESGCRAEIKIVEGCPAVYNDPALFERFRDALLKPARTGVSPADDGGPFSFIVPDRPTMISEDFSEYQCEVPGIFFHLGLGSDTALHSNVFDMDESVLPFGVKAFWRLLYNI
jgi:hippurate hydrolase